jgi:NitT/TauT family transport system permease protein
MVREHNLFLHIGVTLAETLVSFALTIIFTVVTAVCLWLFPRFAEVMEPYLVVLNSLPKSALAPLLIVWLGANMKTIIIAGMSVAVFGSIISLFQGFQEVSQEKMKLIYTLGGGRYKVLTKVVLPASTPYLLSALKVDIGLCLVGVIIGEFIGARQGLGYLIIYSSQVFKLDWLILSIIILCIIAMILYQGVCLIEKWYYNKK